MREETNLNNMIKELAPHESMRGYMLGSVAA